MLLKIYIYFLRYNIKVKYFLLAKSKLNSIEAVSYEAVYDRRFYNCSDLKLDLYCYIDETL